MNKKARIQWAKVIGSLAIVLTLLILVGSSSEVYKNSRYDAMVKGCSIISESIHNTPTYFSTLSEPNQLLFKALAEACPSKETKITSLNVDRVATLANNCWKSYSAGVDILSPQSYNQNICVYCGTVEVDEDISNFNTKFSLEVSDDDYKTLFEESETLNINTLTLTEEGSLPESLSEGDNLMVYYFIYKPNFDFEIGDDLIEDYSEIFVEYYANTYSEAAQFISGFGFTGTKIAQLLPGNFETSMAGVAIEPFRRDNYEFDTQESVHFDLSSDLKAKCSNFVVPLEHFD